MHINKSMKWNNALKYLLLYGSFLIYSVSAICSKVAAGQDRIVGVIIFLGLEVFCLAIYALLWQQTLKNFTLVTAMASKGIVVIFNLAWSVFLFREEVTVYNIIGAMVIIAGIWMVSSDG